MATRGAALKKRETTNRGQSKHCAKHNVPVGKVGFDMLSTPLIGPPDQRLVQRISELGRKKLYEKRSILFAQGEQSSTILLLLKGSAKLSVTSPDGRALILGFLGPGTVLGLAATILGKTYEATAETVEPTTAISLPRNAFLKLVEESAKTAFEAAELLGEQCFDLLGELRTIGLSGSAQQRLAAFLLGLRPQSKNAGGCIRLPGASQEDLAQMVGLSRETASRLLARFKKRGVLDWNRSSLVVRNWGALQKLAAFEIGGRARERSSGRKALVMRGG